MTHGNGRAPHALIVGASRGLGCAMAAELVTRGWRVTGTVRGQSRTPLHDLAAQNPRHVRIEHLDITSRDDLQKLRTRMTGTQLDVLFVNAGTTNHEQTPIGDVPAQDFAQIMVTNALSPMQVIERLDDLVTRDGLIGVMSSGQGSITNNTTGGREVYRGSKAALNIVHAQLRCSPHQHRPRPAVDGPGLDPHRPRRRRRALQRRGMHPDDRGRPALAPGNHRSSIPRPLRPHGAVVTGTHLGHCLAPGRGGAVSPSGRMLPAKR